MRHRLTAVRKDNEKERLVSEIINNRQQRIEIMKRLIRQLHEGVAETDATEPMRRIQGLLNNLKPDR